jgi:hypothetical protein
VAKKDKMLFRVADGSSISIAPSRRDIHLLDGRHFFHDVEYRKLFGLDFIKGLQSPPPLNVPLLTHGRVLLIIRLQSLLVELETQKDLIAFDYSYSFGDDKRRCGGRTGGFRVEGGYASIDVRPAGYCDLVILDVGPNGRGREVAIIDMRVRRQIETLDRGTLKVHARKAAVGWFDELAKLIEFLERESSESVEILHTTES